MSKAITILNYGVGNVAAFERAFHDLGASTVVGDTPKKIIEASKLVLPGVGSFDWALTKLEQSGFKDSLKLAVERGTPILGVCIGMHMLFDQSEEGVLEGFGWIPGRVVKVQNLFGNKSIVTPIMGWCNVDVVKDNDILVRNGGNRFYFLHSYAAAPDDPNVVIAQTNVGGPIVAAVRHKNIYGSQFHPEKSHRWGREFLKNFWVAG